MWDSEDLAPGCAGCPAIVGGCSWWSLGMKGRVGFIDFSWAGKACARGLFRGPGGRFPGSETGFGRGAVHAATDML